MKKSKIASTILFLLLSLQSFTQTKMYFSKGNNLSAVSFLEAGSVLTFTSDAVSINGNVLEQYENIRFTKKYMVFPSIIKTASGEANIDFYWSLGNSNYNCIIDWGDNTLEQFELIEIDQKTYQKKLGAKDAEEKRIAEEAKRQQEAERKKQIEEENKIAEEARKRKLKSDLELPLVIIKLDDLLVANDTLTILSELETLKKSDLINGNENELNKQKLQKYYNIRSEFNEKLRLKNLRIEKEKERVRLENERIAQEKEKERIRLETERIEKERILSYTTNTILIKNLEIANHDFPSEMNYKDAVAACAALGEGWRLPNKKELKIMYKKQAKIKNFSNLAYWTLMDHNDYKAWTINIAGENKGSYHINEKSDYGNVWAVRTTN